MVHSISSLTDSQKGIQQNFGFARTAAAASRRRSPPALASSSEALVAEQQHVVLAEALAVAAVVEGHPERHGDAGQRRKQCGAVAVGLRDGFLSTPSHAQYIYIYIIYVCVYALPPTNIALVGGYLEDQFLLRGPPVRCHVGGRDGTYVWI